MKPFIKYWLPVLLWSCLIFLLSSFPGDKIPDAFWGQAVVAHLLEYAILALLLSRALNNTQFVISKNNQGNTFFLASRPVFWVILFCLIYAISDEFHQQFVPDRISSLTDLIIDGFGIVLGAFIYQMKPRLTLLRFVSRLLIKHGKD